VNPLLPAIGLTLCLLIGLRGLVLARSAPAGAERLLGLRDVERQSQGSLLTRLRTALGRRFGRSFLRLMSEKRRNTIRHRIDAAGRPGGLTLEGYAAELAASIVMTSAMGLILMALTANVLLLVAFPLLGWLQVDLRLTTQAKRRQAQIDRDLPDFLDVLTVTVQAGLGFRDALGRVADALPGPLGAECRIALQQMGYGAARRTAFEGIRDRSDSEALGQFMTALLQAEELGAPLGDALQAIAEDMRKTFGQIARRQAARAVPRISVIIAVTVLPAVIILLLSTVFIASGTDFGAFFGGP
jgi:tight adherence protein C